MRTSGLRTKIELLQRCKDITINDKCIKADRIKIIYGSVVPEELTVEAYKKTDSLASISFKLDKQFIKDLEDFVHFLKEDKLRKDEED